MTFISYSWGVKGSFAAVGLNSYRCGLKPVNRMVNLIKAPIDVRLKCNQLAFILIEKQCLWGDFDHHVVWRDFYPKAFWLRWDCFSLCVRTGLGGCGETLNSHLLTSVSLLHPPTLWYGSSIKCFWIILHSKYVLFCGNATRRSWLCTWLCVKCIQIICHVLGIRGSEDQTQQDWTSYTTYCFYKSSASQTRHKCNTSPFSWDSVTFASLGIIGGLRCVNHPGLSNSFTILGPSHQLLCNLRVFGSGLWCDGCLDQMTHL